MCTFGINTILEATATQPADHCESAPFYFWVYMVINIAFNILIVMILKYGSSNILWLSSTVLFPSILQFISYAQLPLCLDVGFIPCCLTFHFFVTSVLIFLVR